MEWMASCRASIASCRESATDPSSVKVGEVTAITVEAESAVGVNGRAAALSGVGAMMDTGAYDAGGGHVDSASGPSDGIAEIVSVG